MAVQLAGIAAARHERVELHVRLGKRLEAARRGHEHARAAGVAHRLDVAGGQVHGIRVVEAVPGERVGTARAEPRAEHRDRALAALVHMDEGAAMRLGAKAALDVEAQLLEPGRDRWPTSSSPKAV